MNKYDFLDAIAEAITNNSDIEAEDGDSVLFTGVEDVMENVTGAGTESVTVLFEDGTVIHVTAEESKEVALTDDL